MLIKLMVFGSRGFGDTALVSRMCDKIIEQFNIEDVTVISGGARGADRCGEVWAAKREMDTIILRPKWSIYGKQAGHRRNLRLGDMCTHAVAFWDGESPGTAHSIRYIKKLGKPLIIVYYTNEDCSMEVFNWGTEQ